MAQVLEAGRPHLGQQSGDVGILTAVSWTPPHELELAEWARRGQRLGTAGRASKWWIGDWLNYGAARYGEHYVRAAAISGYEVQSLMNMAYVGSRFEISRRRENLSWSHHAELAALPIPQQEAWLDRAASDRLSVHELRSDLRVAKATPTRERAAEAEDADAVVCPSCGHRFSAP